MAYEFWLSKEAFYKIAEASGLATAEEHMNELYSFIQSILPSFKEIEELDLAGVEPFVPPVSRPGGGT